MNEREVDAYSNTAPRSNANDDDCLAEVINRAENATGGTDENPSHAAALEQHVLMDTSDGDTELMCSRCPVTCTVKDIGGHALALLHDSEECINLPGTS